MSLIQIICNTTQYMHFILTPSTSISPNGNQRIRPDVGLITLMAAEVTHTIRLSSTVSNNISTAGQRVGVIFYSSGLCIILN